MFFLSLRNPFWKDLSCRGAFSLLDEVLRQPEAWIPAVCAAPAVQLATETARELIAEVHARRAADPRRFQQASS